MHMMIDSSVVQNVVPETIEEVRTSSITTTLYDLMAAMHDIVDPGEDELVIATLCYQFRVGRIAFIREPHSACLEFAL